MPLFSIGVPTYNRKELLKQTLRSILDQTFDDFEVIVGNDYISEKLTKESLGIEDARIRIINNQMNLGESGNMNELLKEARGKYFTWQFDDDVYSPYFLEEVYSALNSNKDVDCVYTSYGWIWNDSYPNISKKKTSNNIFSGKSFVKLYFAGKIKTAGSCGVYEINSLRNMGGNFSLIDYPIAIHSEFLLLTHSRKFEKIVYINSPLFFSRYHQGTFSGSNTKADLYKIAGINLIREVITFYNQFEIEDDYQIVIEGLIKTVVQYYIMRYVGKEGGIPHKLISELLIEIRETFNASIDQVHYEVAVTSYTKLLKKKWVYSILLANIKWNSPRFVINIIKELRSFFSKLN